MSANFTCRLFRVKMYYAASSRDHHFVFSSILSRLQTHLFLNLLRFAKTTILSCTCTKLDFGPAPQSASWMEKGEPQSANPKRTHDTLQGRLIQCMTQTGSMISCDVRWPADSEPVFLNLCSLFRQQGCCMCTLRQLCVNLRGLSGETLL